MFIPFRYFGAFSSTALVSLCLFISTSASAQSNPDTACYEVNKKDTVYKMTCGMMEQLPEFPGGIDSLIKFIKMNVHYPKLAKSMGIMGKVYIGFIVEKDGRVSNVTILKGVNYPAKKKHESKKDRKNMNDAVDQLNNEGLRVVALLPPFAKPGIQDGKPVRVKYSLPIKFSM